MLSQTPYTNYGWPLWLQYGEYGGPNHSGEQRNPDGSLYRDPDTNQTVQFFNEPLDALDTLFMNHDRAYEAAETGGNSLAYIVADVALLNGMKNLDPSQLDASGQAYRQAAIPAFSWKILNGVTTESISMFKNIFTTATQSVLPTRRIDPLILDLDGDGIETIKVATGVNFDHDGNGFSEQSGWIKPDDGLLVLDRNGDGIISDGHELFGDQTILQNGNRATNGYQALAEWDATLDGRIDANDAIWSSLKIWQDSNSDGLSSEDELHTLDELGVASIGLANTTVNTTDANGNIMAQTGSFTKTDGTTGQTGSFLFSRDTTFTTATEWLPETADITALADLQGYGNVYTLHQAMLRDTSGILKGLVESFSAATDEANRSTIMEQILFVWTGSDTIDPASRGTLVDARKLHALEMMYGQAFWGMNGANPNSVAVPLLNQSYQGMYDTFYAQLMA